MSYKYKIAIALAISLILQIIQAFINSKGQMDTHLYILFLVLSFLVGLAVGIIFSRKAYGFHIDTIKTDLRHIRNEVDHMRIDVSYFTEGHGPSAVHHEHRHVADNEETLDTLRQQMRESGISTDTIDEALNTINSVSNRISNIGRSLRFPGFGGLSGGGLGGLGGGTSYSYTSFYHGPARNAPNQLPDPPSEIPINGRREQRQQQTNPEHPELEL